MRNKWWQEESLNGFSAADNSWTEVLPSPIDLYILYLSNIVKFNKGANCNLLSVYFCLTLQFYCSNLYLIVTLNVNYILCLSLKMSLNSAQIPSGSADLGPGFRPSRPSCTLCLVRIIWGHYIIMLITTLSKIIQSRCHAPTIILKHQHIPKCQSHCFLLKLLEERYASFMIIQHYYGRSD